MTPPRVLVLHLTASLVSGILMPTHGPVPGDGQSSGLEVSNGGQVQGGKNVGMREMPRRPPPVSRDQPPGGLGSQSVPNGGVGPWKPIVPQDPVSRTTFRPPAPAPAFTTVAPPTSTTLEDLPPAELFPPPRNEEPRLLSAGAKTLFLGVTFLCNRICPNIVFFSYKNETEKTWQEINVTPNKGKDKCNATVKLEELEPNTTYLVRAKPMMTNSTSMTEWYKSTKNSPYTATKMVNTCKKHLQEVEDLRVHTTGHRWMALSWIPPTSSCMTQLEYQVRHYATLNFNAGSNSFSPVGSFWTNSTWAVEGKVTPCVAWPTRHCLLLMEDLDQGKEYIIEVMTKRTIDGEESNKAKLFVNLTDLDPGPPEDLRCVRAESTALNLRWGSPLVPGGRLAQAHVTVRQEAGGGRHVERSETQNVNLRAEYSQRVEGLNPNAFYKVTVSFKTVAGREGEPASITVWTTPAGEELRAGRTIAAVGDPCRSLHPSLGGMEAASSRGGEFDGRYGAPWSVFGVCVVLLFAIVIAAFFFGKRFGSGKNGSRTPQDDDDKGSAGGKTSTLASENAALCLSPGAQPSCTPPSSLQDYAEVEPTTGRGAWTASPSDSRTQHPPRISAHHYEELKNGAAPYLEEPYAVACDATSLPPSYYAEVRRPSPVPPLPQSLPPVYAQVDKKRPPPPPAPPVAARRHVLQDSD